jgi:choline-sulfatase
VLERWDPEAITDRVLASQANRALIWGVSRADSVRDNWSYEFRKGDKQRWVRGGGDQEGTNAVKGRMRFPFVTPVQQADPQPIPDVPGFRR